jgi:hypothetical protein
MFAKIGLANLPLPVRWSPVLLLLSGSDVALSSENTKKASRTVAASNTVTKATMSVCSSVQNRITPKMKTESADMAKYSTWCLNLDGFCHARIRPLPTQEFEN